MKKTLLISLIGLCLVLAYGVAAKKWPRIFKSSLVSKAQVLTVSTLTGVHDDPLVRMPGTQPSQGVSLEAPTRCLNCHAGYNSSVEPGFNWKGSMMAQAARDPLFWSCLTVGINDSMTALNGSPNAADICERCHFPEGWLGGRSDPPNASAMSGSDFDGLHCDFCHQLYDPFFETTYAGTREGNDWIGYWDEANNTGTTATLSQTEAQKTWYEDRILSGNIALYSGAPFYNNYTPKYASTYTLNGSGQYYVSPNGQKRASFADAKPKHQFLYSRYHKSKFMCATCHDVSNPVLANLGLSGLQDQSGGADLITEQYSASNYFHVERTFSEFMLSDYGLQGGAATNADFQAQGAPGIQWAAKCQDCHMRDGVGPGCNKAGVPIRPDGSTEHPNSGLPIHDLTGGNAWISYILSTLDPNGPTYDPVNVQLLDQGKSVLTLDLSQGESPKQNGAQLKAGSDRAKQQLQLAATIKNVTYSPSSGTLSFIVQNNSAHKLISGFPEGRRMFVNIKAYSNGGTNLIYEVNPYNYAAGTLDGLDVVYNTDTSVLPAPKTSAQLVNAEHEDELVYEMRPAANGEETFHFVLADSRYKDNRIPPRGFRVSEATARLSEPVWDGAPAPNYYTSQEYAGGYDAVTVDLPPGADYVEVNLYYQTTSREYIEFLRDEISNTPNIQSSGFFDQLRAWGPTIWQLWLHNMNVDGAKPFLMTQGTWGTGPTACSIQAPTLSTATPSSNQVSLNWSTVSGATGYKVYYDQAGKSQLITDTGNTTTYTDKNLTNGSEYCYKVTAYDATCESTYSNVQCATPTAIGQTQYDGVTQMETGVVTTTGKGKNQTTTFTLTSTFTAGDAVIIRAYVKDVDTGLPVSNASVDIAITGPEVTSVTTGPSDANGVAEATWQTSKPNRRGNGGTTPGSYTARVSNVTKAGYTWDSVKTSTTFTIQ